MNAVVVFRTASGRYAVDVASTGAVVEVEDVQPLPAPLPGVRGVMTGAAGGLPLLSVLGDGGRHAVVMQAGARRFAVLVEEVVGVRSVRPGDIQPPPAGQQEAIVTGVLPAAGDALLIDPAALATRLDP